MTTGSVTIPIMKRMGYRADFAGGVEVAASTGGSLVPPVMGAAAFIMAEYTGIRYVDIALAALIPALLYYVPIYMQVHLVAQREGLQGVAEDQMRRVGATLKDGGLFLLPLVAITWALLEGYTPTYSALWGTLAVVAVAMLRAKTRITPSMLFEILYETSTKMVAVVGACAAAGLVIGGNHNDGPCFEVWSSGVSDFGSERVDLADPRSLSDDPSGIGHAHTPAPIFSPPFWYRPCFRHSTSTSWRAICFCSISRLCPR